MITFRRATLQEVKRLRGPCSAREGVWTVWYTNDCCGRWARNCSANPGFIPTTPSEGLSIAEAAAGVKTLRQAAPWLSRAGLQA
ncbi:MAG: hypothetical protein V3W37_03310, partial [Candidatus Binatia bacterium]